MILHRQKRFFHKSGEQNPEAEVNKIIAANAAIDKGNNESIFSGKYKKFYGLHFLLHSLTNGRVLISFYTMHLKFFHVSGWEQRNHWPIQLPLVEQI